MGTRADFYVGKGPDAEWLGSVAWDGYPDGFEESLFADCSESEWRSKVRQLLGARDDATTPDKGWPWPWDTSSTTDYAYSFEAGVIWSACFGDCWAPVDERIKFAEAYEEGEADELQGEPCAFPDMSDRQNVTLGPRSGVIVVGQE